MYFARINHKSDEEWSRILVFMLLDFGGQLTYVIIAMMRVKLIYYEYINIIS